MNPITAAILLLVSVDAGPATSGANADGVPAMTARLDALYARRDDRAAWAEQQKLATQALGRAPGDYTVLWRAARVYFWMSDDPAASNDQRSAWGKQGWDLAEQAIKANPNDVAGHYYAAVCMGSYALGLGIMRALSQGLEGKFKERLKRAEELEPKYQNGGIFIAWGRFYDKLPWPKRDRKKAQQYERQAMQVNPASLRARVYLASSLIEDGRPEEARRLLDEVRAAPIGRYDAPEEKRAKTMADHVEDKLK
ncbi:MAG TPA: tetratricopeptide repeat protein [Polyangia bacterium]|nr:tetratricopeptide repeat protein [Polyangia bacterium]